jgi:hypothetical protein
MLGREHTRYFSFEKLCGIKVSGVLVSVALLGNVVRSYCDYVGDYVGDLALFIAKGSKVKAARWIEMLRKPKNANKTFVRDSQFEGFGRLERCGGDAAGSFSGSYDCSVV